MTPDDTTPPDGDFSKLVDEQLELAAARIPAVEPAVVHPSPVDHEERQAAHPTLEDPGRVPTPAPGLPAWLEQMLSDDPAWASASDP